MSARRAGGRRAARNRAIEILYESALRETAPVTLLRERLGVAEVEPVPDYAVTLVEGIGENLTRIDELLAEHAEGWSLHRMPPLDLAVLRLGLYELLWATDVPDPVAIDEAVHLVKTLSTDDSPRFVNGLLGRIAGIADQLRAAL